ncbi:MAG: hypothetical protein II822_08210 [Prevotella sp.]|nr:hypothetical protein [Prevotella sp.]
MKNKIFSTTYAPLRPPFQVIKYYKDVAIQIGTLIVTFQKDSKKDASDYQIETHSHPVVAYSSKDDPAMINKQLTGQSILEGAVWNNVEVRDVTTVCMSGATLTWNDYLKILEHENFRRRYRLIPDTSLYWQLRKIGVKILPPETRECTVHLNLSVQPEEAGISFQTDLGSPLYLNVSVAEDDDDSGIVFYNKKEGTIDSHVWKDKEEVFEELRGQLSDYRFVLRDLLFHEVVNHFTVTYKTDQKRYQSVIDRLNETDDFVHLSYIG